MATIKFITVKGNGDLAREPFYVGIPQHERTISARETYELCAKHTGYKPKTSASAQTTPYASFLIPFILLAPCVFTS